jgi:hypothetical protein
MVGSPPFAFLDMGTFAAVACEMLEGRNVLASCDAVAMCKAELDCLLGKRITRIHAHIRDHRCTAS